MHRFLKWSYLKRYLWVLVILLGIILYRWFFYYFPYTRDAYVYAKNVDVSSLVAGHITHLYIKNNQPVKKGQLLLTIDPKPFKYAYQRAEARLKQAKIQNSNAKSAVKAAQSNLNEQKAALVRSKAHLNRYQKLYKERAVAQILVINYTSKVHLDQAAVNLAAHRLVIAEQKVNRAEIDHAEAQLRSANYNLHHSSVYAANDGIITNFYLSTGNYVSVGERLFALVQTNRWWIIALYRETLIRRIHVGDRVHIHIDMYPDRHFNGKVVSIGWGVNRFEASTSAKKSSLMYLKPTEDWIRIAQRFPVRILITDVNSKYPLRVGANARTYVKLDSYDRPQ